MAKAFKTQNFSHHPQYIEALQETIIAHAQTIADGRMYQGDRGNCALCKATAKIKGTDLVNGTTDCHTCPWFKIQGETCMGQMNKLSDSHTRIKVLAKWMKMYKDDEKLPRRGDLPFNEANALLKLDQMKKLELSLDDALLIYLFAACGFAQTQQVLKLMKEIFEPMVERGERNDNIVPIIDYFLNKNSGQIGSGPYTKLYELFEDTSDD